MKTEVSFGIIPLQKITNQWHIFIVQMKSGYWGFPKGHAEPHEQPQETAQRELQEETGLLITQYLSIAPVSEQYISSRTHNPKIVTYFFAYVHGTISLCPVEITDGFWATLEQVHQKMGSSKKELIMHIQQLLAHH